jgi:hypothetical protein
MRYDLGNIARLQASMKPSARQANSRRHFAANEV